MIFLRIACLIAGVLVLVAPSVMLAPDTDMLTELPGTVALLAALLLGASSFFVIGMAGRQIRRSPILGPACALILLVPLLGGTATLTHSAEPLTLWMSGMLLCISLLALLALTYMLMRAPSANRVRARERYQAQLLPVRRN